MTADGAKRHALRSLEQVLVQYERAMHELGWTMVNVRAKETLVALGEEADRLREALREVTAAAEWEQDNGGCFCRTCNASLAGPQAEDKT